MCRQIIIREEDGQTAIADKGLPWLAIDLFELIDGSTDAYCNCSNEAEKPKLCRKLIRCCPHIVDAFFYK